MKKYIVIVSLLIIPLFSIAQNVPPSNMELIYLAYDDFYKLQDGSFKN